MPSGKLTEGSDGGGELPPVLSGRDLAAAAVVAGGAYLTALLTAPTVPGHAAVFYIAALLMIASGRLSDRLWDSMMPPALTGQEPSDGSGWRRLAVRFPFRLLGGGIAFTVTLLAAKRAGVIPVRDVPVIEIFATGALLAAAYHAIDEGWRALRRRSGGRTATTTKKGGR